MTSLGISGMSKTPASMNKSSALRVAPRILSRSATVVSKAAQPKITG